jgi:hypothetical protein
MVLARVLHALPGITVLQPVKLLSLVKQEHSKVHSVKAYVQVVQLATTLVKRGHCLVYHAQLERRLLLQAVKNVLTVQLLDIPRQLLL